MSVHHLILLLANWKSRNERRSLSNWKFSKCYSIGKRKKCALLTIWGSPFLKRQIIGVVWLRTFSCIPFLSLNDQSSQLLSSDMEFERFFEYFHLAFICKTLNGNEIFISDYLWSRWKQKPIFLIEMKILSKFHLCISLWIVFEGLRAARLILWKASEAWHRLELNIRISAIPYKNWWQKLSQN